MLDIIIDNLIIDCKLLHLSIDSIILSRKL